RVGHRLLRGVLVVPPGGHQRRCLRPLRQRGDGRPGRPGDSRPVPAGHRRPRPQGARFARGHGMSDLLAGWERQSFTAAGFTRDTYRRGTGPGVIVIHELPGMTPAVIRFADEVVARGFTVLLPDLVGTPGKEVSAPYLVASSLQMCVAREFTAWALHRTSPIVAWLRALARRLHGEVGGPGVGA